MDDTRVAAQRAPLWDGLQERHALVREDPEQNLHRFYRLRLVPDLFAPAALHVAWGRIGAPERIRVAASGEVEDLCRVADRIAGRKLKGGYRPDTCAR